jgi:hypothetical protein
MPGASADCAAFFAVGQIQLTSAMEDRTLYLRGGMDTPRKKEFAMERAWIAFIDWVDGGEENDPDTQHFDCDEIRVFAEDDQQAISTAREIWSATKGAEWPHCRIERVRATPLSRLRTLAEG